MTEIHQEVNDLWDDLWDKTNVCSNRVFVWNDEGEEEGGGEENDVRLRIISLTGSIL